MDFCTRKYTFVQKINLQFVLPMSYRQQAIKACHDDICHLGLEKIIRPSKRFYWPGMNEEMGNHIRNGNRFFHFKSKLQKTELCPIMATHLLELIHMDFLTIELGKTD